MFQNAALHFFLLTTDLAYRKKVFPGPQGANLLGTGSKNYILLEKRRLNGAPAKGQDARSSFVEGPDQKVRK
jgi:hypothetical protein